MSVLRFQEAHREIGTFVILDSVTVAVAAGDRIGLVGVNGAGKTTLLRLAAGTDEPDTGAVHRKRGLTLGLLGQEANLDGRFMSVPTLRSAVRAGARELEQLERELSAMEAAGAEAVGDPRYAELQQRFEALDGYHLDQRVEETLSGLGFDRHDWARSPTELSGGEQTRAALAGLLIADPELLLLDEPTNHLDMAALEWLEAALARRSGALLVASHDRAFLDAVATRIWEVRDRRIATFRGAYSAYLMQREAADARTRKEADTQAAAAAREQELIARYRSHRKFSKMHEHERRLAQMVPVEAPRRSARLALPGEGPLGGGPVRSGDLVVEVRDALVGFSGRLPEGPVPIVAVQRLEARRGERIGIVGPNGAGKTTLLRTIGGALPVLQGVVRLGAAVQPGYLAQVRQRGAPQATVLDALLAAAPLENGPARSYLARFLFRGEDVFKPVSELSGGERSRLELALLGITPANLLLLDEPTNHLDIPAREALEAFLRESVSTLIVVSHDRRLLETVCERLWVVEPAAAGSEALRATAGHRAPGRPATVAAFEGSFRAWRAAVAEGWTVATELEVQSRRLQPDSRAATNGRYATTGSSIPAVTAPPAAAAPQRSGSRGGVALSKDAYRRQKQSVDDDLTRLGLRRSHLELALADRHVQANFVELRRLTSELADVDEALGRAEDAWLTLEERAPR